MKNEKIDKIINDKNLVNKINMNNEIEVEEVDFGLGLKGAPLGGTARLGGSVPLEGSARFGDGSEFDEGILMYAYMFI